MTRCLATKAKVLIDGKTYFFEIEDLLDDIITQNEESEVAQAYHRNGLKIDGFWILHDKKEENSPLRIELTATRSKLVDILKALELACVEIANSTEYCPDDLRKIKKCANTDGYCNDIEQEAKCWKEYFLEKARESHD